MASAGFARLRRDLMLHDPQRRSFFANNLSDNGHTEAVLSNFRIADSHVRPLSREKTSRDARFGGARTIELGRNLQLAHVPLGGGSCLRRTRHPFAVSGPEGPSQKIECVFSASPEIIRREPREFDLRRSVGNRKTWQSARSMILSFFRLEGPRFLRGYALGIWKRYKVALPAIDGEQIRHHLPSNSQRRSISIPFCFSLS